MSKKDFVEEWEYFCSRINFGDSALDARAIQFMNTFNKLLDEECNKRMRHQTRLSDEGKE